MIYEHNPALIPLLYLLQMIDINFKSKQIFKDIIHTYSFRQQLIGRLFIVWSSRCKYLKNWRMETISNSSQTFIFGRWCFERSLEFETVTWIGIQSRVGKQWGQGELYLDDYIVGYMLSQSYLTAVIHQVSIGDRQIELSVWLFNKLNCVLSKC